MPAAVFDFPDIASRLRKDDFFTPKPKPRPSCSRCGDRSTLESNGDIFCRACGNWDFHSE